MITPKQADLIIQEINRLTGKLYDLEKKAPQQPVELVQAYFDLCAYARGGDDE